MEKFLRDTLLRGTRGRVFVCSLPNGDEDGALGEQRVTTRDPERILEFVREWDKPGRATYYCVSTLRRSWRRKENAQEGVFAFADVDLKDLDLTIDELLARVMTLGRLPSRVNRSGHGLHLYWYLASPTDALDRLEAINAKVGKVVAGDPRARHAVTLLRVPGSHNSKGGGWLEVTTITDEPDRRYTMEDLEAWDQEPVVVPKGAAPEEDNPFLRHARESEFRTPVDVDERLASMQHRGVGDASIHLTQLSVTASLTLAGWEEDDVVERVLARTREVCPLDEPWDWVREEAKIRRMCQDIERKSEKQTIVDLAQRRRERARRSVGGSAEPKPGSEAPEEEEEGKSKRGKKKTHVVLGGGVLEMLREGGVQIMVTRESEVWRCRAGVWAMMVPSDVKSWLDRTIEVGCRALKLVSTQHLVSETRGWILRSPDIHRDRVEWDAHGGIAMKNGLLDPRTTRLVPLEPEHYVTSCVLADYDPRADCPHWRRMMEEIFPGDSSAVSLLQEMAGVSLMPRKPRSLMKALILIGDTTSGKSGLLDVLGGMLSDSPNTTTLDLLDTPHGTMDFLRSAPWVLHEAFSPGKWHISSSVKAILTGDVININVKNGPVVSHPFRSSVFWGTNHPPAFRESSRAIASRLAIINCNQKFGEKMTGEALAAYEAGYSSPAEMVLAEERSGLLNWMLEGMRRATGQRHLGLTEEMRQAASDLTTDGNLATAFFRDAVEFDPGSMVSRQDFRAAFSSWYAEEHGSDKAIGEGRLGRDIQTMYEGRVAAHKSELRTSNGTRYYAGIRLSEAGLSFWDAGTASAAARGDSGRMSGTAAEVNRPIPVEWVHRPCIERMLAAYKKMESPP